jgi:DNA polymerase-3 subunit delta'
MSLTAALSPWRVAVIDTVDQLEPSAANALLKILEEPPANTLFFLVSHAPGRLLPTIRSRCRRLALRSLSPDDVARALADALQRDAGEADIKAAATASDGSVARALDLLGGTALKIREQVNTLLGALPAVNPRDLHALGDALGRDESAFAAFVDAVRDWLSARVTAARAEPSRLARFAEVWDRLNQAARDVEIFHLERKPMVFNVFGWLAEASRG